MNKYAQKYQISVFLYFFLLLCSWWPTWAIEKCPLQLVAIHWTNLLTIIPADCATFVVALDPTTQSTVTCAVVALPTMIIIAFSCTPVSVKVTFELYYSIIYFKSYQTICCRQSSTVYIVHLYAWHQWGFWPCGDCLLGGVAVSPTVRSTFERMVHGLQDDFFFHHFQHNYLLSIYVGWPVDDNRHCDQT